MEVPQERHSSPPKKKPRVQIMGEIIDISDDDDINHPHSSNEDDADDMPSKPDHKPRILSDGTVKIEGDWWSHQDEARTRRIVRQKEKDKKDKLLNKVLVST